jgi:hypothetical protein
MEVSLPVSPLALELIRALYCGGALARRRRRQVYTSTLLTGGSEPREEAVGRAEFFVF